MFFSVENETFGAPRDSKRNRLRYGFYIYAFKTDYFAVKANAYILLSFKTYMLAFFIRYEIERIFTKYVSPFFVVFYKRYEFRS